jgi:AMP phosphorylase
MGEGPIDLVNKAASLAGLLFEMMEVNDGTQKAESILKSGKAEKKLREIIAAQGGDPDVQPEDIEVGNETVEIHAEEKGRIQWINNRAMAQIAREAGAPKNRGAGVLLSKKLGDKVTEGDVLYTIFSGSSQKLESSVLLAENLNPIGVTGKFGEKMLVDRIPTKKVSREKPFILER